MVRMVVRTVVINRPCCMQFSAFTITTKLYMEGRIYIVPDLYDGITGKKGITVPSTWNVNNGNVQMVAGDLTTEVYFTNLIYEKRLFTYHV